MGGCSGPWASVEESSPVGETSADQLCSFQPSLGSAGVSKYKHREISLVEFCGELLKFTGWERFAPEDSNSALCRVEDRLVHSSRSAFFLSGSRTSVTEVRFSIKPLSPAFPPLEYPAGEPSPE